MKTLVQQTPGADYAQAVVPLATFIGQTWLNTSTNTLKIWNGTSWVEEIFGGEPVGPTVTGYGYVCGGNTGSYLSTIDRFAFPFDS